ncbi:IS1595 family transposase [Desulfovibrio sp. MES5]|uniref:IS1595 family transposase n=1 Tax=Desulfovibrio sp. MES5 TaxID=1899016 RepID=UPI0025BE2831|nr:IS1595 family transposase [Desulfovibrio sp. MES5]
MTNKEIAEILSKLSSDEKKILFDLLQNENSDELHVDSLFSNGISCPICNEVGQIVKNGKRAGVQRYICKRCKKSFVANTNSILERTHKPISIWKKFLECMVHGMSILKTAELCNINKNTAFAWRHKVLDALGQIVESTPLEGIVEADETFFILSYKGQKRGLPRKPKKRGGSASKRVYCPPLTRQPC